MNYTDFLSIGFIKSETQTLRKFIISYKIKNLYNPGLYKSMRENKQTKTTPHWLLLMTVQAVKCVCSY